VGQAHERSVRDGRWLYIRNAYPALQSLCVESGPAVPAGRELWAGYAARTLKPEQGDVFLQPRPAEELYDVEADPHQLHNLLADAASAEKHEGGANKSAEPPQPLDQRDGRHCSGESNARSERRRPGTRDGQEV
jgi:hypothetical protein